MVLLFLEAGAGRGATTSGGSPFESGGSAGPRTAIDDLVFARLEKLGLKPAKPCSDAVFVRRVYLDVIGTLPTAREASQFLESRASNKREALIDRLLEREEYADYWAMKWSDLLRVKAEFPINLWPNAAQAYHHWIREQVKENVPYDRFARELLTASGSNFRVPPVNFYRAMQDKDPQGIAQAVALTFMGTRTDAWPKERLAGLAAFFGKVGYKSTLEWKEEIVYFDPESTNAAACLAPVFPDGKPAVVPPDTDPREVFADWLIDPKNPWFTRSLANRAWSWLLGRGIIHEPDDLRLDNPPVNPELLSWLEQELVASHYDLKHLLRVILNSQTYQLSSIAPGGGPEADANFSHYLVRRLDAEVLVDAINAITGTTESYSSAIPEPFTYMPPDQRSIALPDASITSSFLEMFGRPPRDNGTELERNNRSTAAQRLYLLNSSHIQRKLEQSPHLQNLMQSKAAPRETVAGLYLMILSRYPTDAEWQAIADYTRSDGIKPRDALVDLAWALVNSAEFLYRH